MGPERKPARQRQRLCSFAARRDDRLLKSSASTRFVVRAYFA
jgi:hypothetical protein